MNFPGLNLKLKSSILLGGEVLLLLLVAGRDELELSAIKANLLFFVLFAAGGFALADSRWWLIVYLASSAAGILFAFAEENALFQMLALVFFFISFGILFRFLFRHCFFQPGVLAPDRILGGISGYFLLGYFWMVQFGWAEIANETAFLNNVTGEAASETGRVYYAFVTLTTLGFGDIVPTTPLARILSIFCVVSGVLYLAIFISSLLGVLSSSSEDSAGSE